MKEKKDINIEIGRRIKIARKNAGFTQEKFAELIGMSPKNISAIERGAVGISVTTVHRICEALSIPSDMLFFDSYSVENDDAVVLTNRLKSLSPKEYEIVRDILNKLIEFTATSKRDC